MHGSDSADLCAVDSPDYNGAMVTSGETLLLVERAGKAEHTFAAALRQKGFALEVVATGETALRKAPELRPVMIILNSASMASSGLRICQKLQEAVNGIPIIHIVEADALDDPRNGVADITLILPFTARKVINSVKRLMPSARNDMIQVGPIKLAPRARVVTAYGKEKRLTARTTSLLLMFLKHPGETLDRGYLMRQVWHTDYLGDTRTLDVHIRWVRMAVERDPQKPRHIITVRGQGYRFSPDPVK